MASKNHLVVRRAKKVAGSHESRTLIFLAIARDHNADLPFSFVPRNFRRVAPLHYAFSWVFEDTCGCNACDKRQGHNPKRFGTKILGAPATQTIFAASLPFGSQCNGQQHPAWLFEQPSFHKVAGWSRLGLWTRPRVRNSNIEAAMRSGRCHGHIHPSQSTVAFGDFRVGRRNPH